MSDHPGPRESERFRGVDLSLVRDEAVAELISRAQHEIDTGRLPACQLALARDGAIVADVTLGAAAHDARFTVFSVTKAYVAAAVWLLIGDGLLAAHLQRSEMRW